VSASTSGGTPGTFRSVTHTCWTQAVQSQSFPSSELSKLSKVVREDIIPLLEEYCYEDYALLERILGQGLLDTNSQQIRHELFEESMQTDLVQALLAPCPEIATSLQVVALEARADLRLEESIDETTDEVDGGTADTN
jgi:5-methylcytosine-specific restriction protein B